MINEAINLSVSSDPGPVHINIPFSEPLYETVDTPATNERVISQSQTIASLAPEELNEIQRIWNSSNRKMVLCGLLSPQNGLNTSLEAILHDPSVSVFTETTANLFSEKFNPSIDRVISTLSEDDQVQFLPDLVVSIGGAIVSKKLKALLRKNPPKHHWHIGEGSGAQDMFRSLTKVIKLKPAELFKLLSNEPAKVSSSYFNLWKQRDYSSLDKHSSYIQSAPFSDLKAYDIVLDSIPDGTVVQMGNSTSVRYVQLFKQIKGLSYYCNRGTSGIDGSTSTALGSKFASKKPTVLLTGDISFFYDSNAFWNSPVKDNFKVILFNNSGGGIFKIIDGPSSTNGLSQFFETPHKLSAQKVAELYEINYTSAKNSDELSSGLEKFLDPSNTNNGILEIFTNPNDNPKVLKKYFDSIKS